MTDQQPTEREEVGRQRRSLRILSGIGSQADLAEATGLARPTISAAEAGADIKSPTLLRIAAALGCTTDEYLGRSPESAPKQVAS